MQATAWRVTAQDISRPPEGAPAYIRHAYARAAVIRTLRCVAEQIPDDAEIDRRERERDEARHKHACGEVDAATLAWRESVALASSPDGKTPPPRRYGGEPWAWRGELLIALPLWPPGYIHSALARLVAEGLAECAGARWGRQAPPREALAVRLTPRGADPRTLAFRYPPDSLEAELVRAAFAPPEGALA
jgi:hypothetical protein